MLRIRKRQGDGGRVWKLLVGAREEPRGFRDIDGRPAGHLATTFEHERIDPPWVRHPQLLKQVEVSAAMGFLESHQRA